MKKYFTPLKKSEVKAIAIGCFDGMHLGHQELFKNLGEFGAVVIIEKDGTNLTKGAKRQDFTAHTCFIYDLHKIKHLSGEEFIKLLKVEFVNLEKIVVGYDFYFGKNRACDISCLKRLFQGEVLVIPEFFYNKMSVHASDIRAFLQNADIKNVTNLLGRFYEIEGDIIKGQGLGKKKLYATLNLDIKDYYMPKNGVYVTFTKVQDRLYKSISFIGNRLSTDNNFSVETHILENFNQDQETPENATIIFVDFIRDNKKFDNLPNLKAQISEDIKLAKQILGNINAG